MKRYAIIFLLFYSICLADIFTSHLKPTTDISLDIGTASLLWRTVYADIITDNTASWKNSSLSGFLSISGLTLTDTVLTITDGSISSAVSGTFSDALAAGSLTDGVATLFGGNLTGMGDITGTDVDISAGTGDYSSTGTLTVASLTVDKDTAGTDAVITMDGSSNDALTLTYESDNALLIINKNVQLDVGLVVDTDTLVVDAVNHRVGIGTATPGSKLTVYTTEWNTAGIPLVSITNLDMNATDADGLLVRGGANNASSDIFKVQDYSGNIDFVVVGHGKVGIGTSSPGAKLEVSGNETRIRLHETGTNTGQSLGIDFYHSGSNYYQAYIKNIIESGWGSRLEFGVNDIASGSPTTAMTISETGKVGIGTTTPDATLQVVGDVHIGDDATNETQIGSTGNITLHGSARVRNEIVLDMASIKIPATNPAGLGEVQMAGSTIYTPVFEFDPTGVGADEQLFISQHMPEYIDGTVNMTLHLVWQPDDGDGGTDNYEWNFDYLVTSDESFDYTAGSATTITEDVTPSDAVTVLETKFSDTIDIGDDEVIWARLWLDKSDSGADDDGNVFFMELSFVQNKIGEPLGESYLLLETGDFLLLEDGTSYMILEI